MRAGNVEVMIHAGTGREAEAFDKALSGGHAAV
jgi:hypothetical protein